MADDTSGVRKLDLDGYGDGRQLGSLELVEERQGGGAALVGGTVGLRLLEVDLAGRRQVRIEPKLVQHPQSERDRLGRKQGRHIVASRPPHRRECRPKRLLALDH